MANRQLHFNNKTQSTAAIIFMVACAFAIAYLQYLTPWQGDDLVYGLKWKNAMIGDGEGIGLRKMWDFACRHYVVTNGRIGDKLILWLLTDLSKLTTALFSGFASFCMFWFGSLTAFGSIKNHPLRACMLTGLIVCCMPWYISIFSTNVVLNYLWGTGLLAIVVWLFMRKQNLSLTACVGVLILSFIASGWHEACSVPLCAGIILFLALNPDRNRRVRFVILAGMVTGMILTLCAPGFWDRIDRELLPEDNGCIQPFPIMVRGILWGINVGLLTFAAPVLLIRKRKREISNNYTMLSFGCMACMCIMVSIGIFFMTGYSLRVFWYCDFVALIAVCAMISAIISPISYKLRRIIAWSLSGFVLLHLCVSIYWQRCLSNQYSDILKAYIASADGTVYYDYSGNGYGPLLNMRKAQIFSFKYEMRFNPDYIMRFYRNDSTILSLIPTGLKDFDMNTWPQDKSIAIINSHIISRDSTIIQKYGRIIYPFYTYTDGKKRRIRTLLNPFRSKDGEQLYYFEIDTRVGDNNGIVEVEL